MFQGTGCWVTTQSSMDFLTLTSWVTFAKMQKLSWLQSYLLISKLPWVLFFSTNIILLFWKPTEALYQRICHSLNIPTNSFSIFLIDWWMPANLSPPLKCTVVQEGVAARKVVRMLTHALCYKKVEFWHWEDWGELSRWRAEVRFMEPHTYNTAWTGVRSWSQQTGDEGERLRSFITSLDT